MRGILDHSIADTPVAVVDFETTGLYAGPDRVVEATVVRIDPGCGPEIVFDSLIHPARRMGATFVHGITDHDVADAPRFDDVAGRFLDALSGCVVAAYNAQFDMSFLAWELQQVGICDPAPHVCLMYMRPLLNLGRVAKLGEACLRHGVKLSRAHTAAGDALASAQLWVKYRSAIEELGLGTFEELAQVKNYRFTQSFGRPPLEANEELSRAPVKSRCGWRAEATLWT